jgi:hypothetical protein
MAGPVFVFGTGRCGTSTVARLLHERLGVCMGQRFRQPCDDNPEGFYEDLDFKEGNEWVLNQRKVTQVTHWFSAVKSTIARREDAGVLWGLKDPRLCYLGEFYLTLCPDAQIVWCDRSIQAVAESMGRCYRWSPQAARDEAHRRKGMLWSLLKERDTLRLAFDEPRTDDDLVEKLTAYLEVPDHAGCSTA